MASEAVVPVDAGVAPAEDHRADGPECVSCARVIVNERERVVNKRNAETGNQDFAGFTDISG
eukprot:1259209-Pyramimonas_sp.AAC.1